jgi:hypothetical protein
MRRIYEYVPEGAKTSRDTPPEKQWWNRAPVQEFKERLQTMSIPELSVLSAEISGAIAVTQAQIEGRDRATAELSWLHRARRALGFLTEKRRLVSAEQARRQAARHQERVTRSAANVVEHAEQEQIRHEKWHAAHAALEAGDLAGAVKCLIEYLAPRKAK